MFPDRHSPPALPVLSHVQYEWVGQALVEVPPTRCPIGDHDLAPGDLLVGWSAIRRYDCQRCGRSWAAESGHH